MDTKQNTLAFSFNSHSKTFKRSPRINTRNVIGNRKKNTKKYINKFEDTFSYKWQNHWKFGETCLPNVKWRYVNEYPFIWYFVIFCIQSFFKSWHSENYFFFLTFKMHCGHFPPCICRWIWFRVRPSWKGRSFLSCFLVVKRRRT